MTDTTDPFLLFADEASELTQTAEASLFALEEGDRDAIHGLYRAMHSLKGNARVMGFAATEAVAHAAEDAAGLVRDHGHEPDPRFFDLLFQSLDVIADGCARSAEARADVPPHGADALGRDLRAYVDGHAPTASAPVPLGLPSHEPGDLFLFDGEEVVSIVDVMDSDPAHSWVPRAAPAGELVGLTYCSRATRPMDLLAIERLLRSCRARNAETGITGQLLSTRSWFLQYVEGPRATVNALYRKIIVDPRHEDVTILAYESLSERRMAEWSMGYAGMGPKLTSLLEQLTGHAEVDASTIQPEVARELLASLRPPSLSRRPPGTV